jgi:hypothetical protein
MMDVINVWLAVRSEMTNERCRAVACMSIIVKKKKEVKFSLSMPRWHTGGVEV